jgi:hypothetical protein
MKINILILFISIVSIPCNSQTSSCFSDKNFIPGILNCVNANSYLTKKYKFRKIVTYYSKHKRLNYKKADFYTVYSIIDSNLSVQERYFKKGKLSSETIYYFNADNQIKKWVSKSNDSTLGYYIFPVPPDKVQFEYENGNMVEKSEYLNDKLLKRYLFEYDSLGRKSKTFWEDSTGIRLRETVHYNEKGLVDTLYQYTLKGERQWVQVLLYDSLENVVEEKQNGEILKCIKVIKTEYKYSSQRQILEKKVKISDCAWDDILVHYKYEYKKTEKKEIRTEYKNKTDSIISIQETKHDNKDNLIHWKCTFGYDKGNYRKYKYDSTKELILYSEDNYSKERQYRIYN